MNLEEFLLTEEILADDKYVTNGACLISKEYLNSIVFKIAKNEENIFKKCKETVPLEKGKLFPIQEGTKLEIQGYKIALPYNTEYSFDYEYIQMILDNIPSYKNPTTYVVENKRGEPILKFFVGEKIVGCLMSMRNRGSNDK